MEIRYTPDAIKDLSFWKKSGNKIIQKRIVLLLKDILEHPYSDIGKPEPLSMNYLENGQDELIKNLE